MSNVGSKYFIHKKHFKSNTGVGSFCFGSLESIFKKLIDTRNYVLSLLIYRLIEVLNSCSMKYYISIIWFLLFSSLYGLSAQVYPEKGTYIYFTIKSGEDVAQSNVLVELRDNNNSASKETNTRGKVDFLVELGKTYTIYLDRDSIEQIKIPSRVSRPLIKKLVFKKTETASVTSDSRLSSQTLGLKIKVNSSTGQLIIGEHVIIESSSFYQDVVVSSDGFALVEVPTDQFLSISFPKHKNHTRLYYSNQDAGKTKEVVLVYPGTENLEREARKKVEKIDLLKAKMKELEELIDTQKDELENHSSHIYEMRRVLIEKFLILSNYQSDTEQYLTLDKAVEEGLISLRCRGNSNSTHYISPLVVVIENKSDRFLNVTIETGRTFTSVSGSGQKLIVTKKNLISIRPGNKQTRIIYAMCIQANNSSPRNNMEYKLTGVANDNMLTLARFIEEESYHNPIGQSAMWVLSDNQPIDGVSGYDKIAADKSKEVLKILTLQGFCEEILEKQKQDQIKLDNTIDSLFILANKEIYKPVDPRLVDYSDSKLNAKVQGFFECNLSRRSKVMIAMFNTDGILVRELLYQPNVGSGSHRFDFAFDSSIYTEETYLFKLIVNGDVVKELRL